jgi:hypothetical protein
MIKFFFPTKEQKKQNLNKFVLDWLKDVDQQVEAKI